MEIAAARNLFADRFGARAWYDAFPAAAALCDQLMQALRDKVELAGTLTTTELEALAQLTERVARLSKLVQDSNLDERRVRIGEVEGQAIADVLKRALADLGHDPTVPYVLRVVSNRMAELEGGS